MSDMTEGLGMAVQKAIYLLGGEAAVNQAVIKRLGYHGIQVAAFTDTASLVSTPAASDLILVLDLAILDKDQPLADLLKILTQWSGADAELVCIAPARQLSLRLQAWRAGVLAYYEAPVSPDELVSWLAERCGQGPADPYRVLVVGNRWEDAVTIAERMNAAGMRSRVSTEPLKVLELAESFRPDLLIMELDMLEVTGPELARLVREYDDFAKTPVLFLAEAPQSKSQLHALRCNGDDCLPQADAEQLAVAAQNLIQVARIHGGSSRHRPDRDAVSGLYNRQAFLKRINGALADDSMLEPGNGVFFIALDRPQAVVERIGQGCLDHLLGYLGARIKGLLSPIDTAGRIGDFSFAVLARCADEKALNGLAESLREAIADQDYIGGAGTTTVSIGIGLFRPRADDALTMISRARKGCAKAQSKGGNRVMAYVPTLPSTMAPGRGERLAALVSASLYSGGLELMYQPIVPIRKSVGQRYEAALRLRAPDGEYIPAFNFLPTAREYGLMPHIDRWVMGHALDRLKLERLKPSSKGLRFFVHQTMETAIADGWIPWLRDQIAERELIRVRPIIQFPLGDVLDCQAQAGPRFSDLHRLSIKVCLIQFDDRPGALDMMANLSVPLVKLAMDFVKEAEPARLSALVSALHRRRIAVIAAGIDSPALITRLWGCGVDFVQGNFLQLPAEELSFDFDEIALR